METLLGIKGPDFVMVAADSTQAQSIIMMKEGMCCDWPQSRKMFGMA